MIAGKRVLAVVPARGGSKGLPRKNLKAICGIPLVALAGMVARQVAAIDRAVVSTDSEEIVEAAAMGGLAAPFMRPPEISGDLIGDVDVLTQALLSTEAADDCRYDIVVMLQPTSPLRTPAEVKTTIDVLVANDADSVWTVSPASVKYHPLKQLRVDDGRLTYFDPRGPTIIARQQLTDTYVRNGVAYALSRRCLLEMKVLMGPRSFASISGGHHISIDTAEDLVAAESAAVERNLLSMIRRSGPG